MSHPQATIETNLGNITIELWEDVAPNHVKNMLELGEKGFYDGLAFHRILPGFVIQGGCLGRDKCQHLDGEYTAFGKVIDGLDVVDAIAAVDIDPHSGAPTGDMPRMTGGIRPIVAG